MIWTYNNKIFNNMINSMFLTKINSTNHINKSIINSNTNKIQNLIFKSNVLEYV